MKRRRVTRVAFDKIDADLEQELYDRAVATKAKYQRLERAEQAIVEAALAEYFRRHPRA